MKKISRKREYEELTEEIIRRFVKPSDNCIDIGCHTGDVLECLLKQVRTGKIFCFEPLPHLFEDLVQTYRDRAEIYPYALSDTEGTSTFLHVRNAPAYSGFRKRDYEVTEPDIEEVSVQVRRLDSVISSDLKADFMKIDVEGAEFGVLKGASELIKRSKPIIVFEFELGSCSYYGSEPEEVYHFIREELGLEVSLLRSFLDGEPALTEIDFSNLYRTYREYYFVAHPKAGQIDVTDSFCTLS